MLSDLTAAELRIEEGFRGFTIGLYVGDNPIPTHYAYHYDGYRMQPNDKRPATWQFREDAEAALKQVSQPLYRRRKAEWVGPVINGEVFAWKKYLVFIQDGKWHWRIGGIIEKQECATKELAQAACEDHFWAELERDVLERVN